MNATINQLLNHRSVRKFTEQTVDTEVLESVLKSAQAASTSSFLQAYSIVNISKGPAREALTTYCGDQPWVANAPVFLVFLADFNRLHRLCDMAEKPYDGGWTEQTLIGTVDAAIAAQNALVAAESLGLGGVYIGGIRNCPDEVSKLLKLPAEVYPVVGLCLGYPEKLPEIKERMPIEMLVHEEVYHDVDQAVLEAYDDRITAYYTRRTKGKITDSWTASVAKKLGGEMRPHMKGYLNRQKMMIK